MVVFIIINTQLYWHFGTGLCGPWYRAHNLQKNNYSETYYEHLETR